MRRGQVSIEFFLVVAFVLALASALLTVTEEQARQTGVVDRAALAKSALDTFAQAANHAWLSGNGARIYAEIFIPQNSVCLLYNASQTRFYCDVGARCPGSPSQFCYAYSERLLTSEIYINSTTCPPSNTLPGWYSVQLAHNGTALLAQCAHLG